MTSSSRRARTISSALGALALLGVVLLATDCQRSTIVTPMPGQPTLPGQTRLWSFESDPTGGAPRGSRSFSGAWETRADSGAFTPPNMLCQVQTSEFPALLLADDDYADLDVSTWFFLLSGKEDRAAGIIFRVQGQNDYYIIRANALEKNVSLYKYEDGRRELLDSDQADVRTGVWQSLRVTADGERVRAYLDDRAILSTDDDTFASGGIGLWTKADSRTCFDDVRATKKSVVAE